MDFSHASYLSDQYGSEHKLNSRIDLHRLYSTNSVSWEAWVFSHLYGPEHSWVLDLGCGSGLFWQENGMRVPPGWRCIISDKSSGMLKAAKANCQVNKSQVTFAVVDAESIPFANSEFEVVIANHMLYHVSNLTRCLEEIRRVLRPGGVLCASTNGPGHLKQIRELAEAVCPEAADLWDAHGEVIARFDLESGEHVLQQYFPCVQRQVFTDELHVTASEPLVAYMLSGPMGALLNGRVPELIKVIERQLDEHGAITITKVCGTFLATDSQPD